MHELHHSKSQTRDMVSFHTDSSTVCIHKELQLHGTLIPAIWLNQSNGFVVLVAPYLGFTVRSVRREYCLPRCVSL